MGVSSAPTHPSAPGPRTIVERPPSPRDRGDLLMMSRTMTALGLVALLAGAAVARPEEAPSAEKGRKALTEKHYLPPSLSLAAYEGIWKVWGLKEKPAPEELHRLLGERYGLPSAPY